MLIILVSLTYYIHQSVVDSYASNIGGDQGMSETNEGLRGSRLKTVFKKEIPTTPFPIHIMQVFGNMI